MFFAALQHADFMFAQIGIRGMTGIVRRIRSAFAKAVLARTL
jgi:hypothetical protein